jgi:hypothetical protein
MTSASLVVVYSRLNYPLGTAFFVFLKGFQSHGFGSLKPNHVGYLKLGWRRGLNRLFKCLLKSSRCVFASLGDGRFLVAL